jgi:signal transduction histidine kinase
VDSRTTHSREVSESDPPRGGWSRVLTPKLLAGFVLILIILVATLVVGLVNLRHVYTTSVALEHTYAVKIALQQLLAATLDAETGERGFIITGAASYLEPYERGRVRLSANLAQLRALTVRNREHQADVDRLAAATALKLEELALAIGQRRESGFTAAQTMVATNVGKRTMDEARAIVARMEAREDALTALRTAQEARSYRTARLTEFVSTGVAFFAVVALFFVTERYGAERMRAVRAAEAQQAQLREALQLKDEFVALVAHELRTPTNTIVGWARMLEEGTLNPDRADKAVAAISRNAASLRQLIDDLMDTSQLVSGRMRLTIGVVDLAEVVRDAIEAARLSADNKSVALMAHIEPGLPSMQGDAGRLKQVVWNLAANAIKFTPKGGEVTVRLASNDRGLRLEVRDSGIGIDAAFLPHVFERFRQATVPSAGQGGVGLGLAIVRHLVELHGGTVSAHSAGLGQGSTFVIELPITTPGAAPG